MKKILIIITACLAFSAQLLHAQTVKAQSPPVIVLSFDDAEESHYINVAPLLKKFHFGATFMVCEFPVKPPADSSYYMTWKQIRELYDMGFEIGNHTARHNNLTKMSADEIKKSVGYIEDKCKQYGIPKPISFAYPGNRNDSAAEVVLKQMGYKYARTGGSVYFTPGKDSYLAIPSYTMGSTEKLQPRTMEALENLRPGQILAFTIHGIPDPVHDGYTTSVDVFTKYLEYMRDHHFKVIAMRDLSQYITN
ncbi:polysaccharide deacetylase family protein [Mucilaginibacter sp. HMF5004]|uniref:polysaccharide deacetylase family protein n=1 Tax=Mucilaginibacter rivuli TaxID=2857527 RepID=UPI001C5F39A7|nr:polysaccharide deacetylase family protein [Mucilaginibacter rivuli]MBW4888987.1 polysaccharide deacetylase family protein [Mucilaginibacter rivuli]